MIERSPQETRELLERSYGESYRLPPTDPRIQRLVLDDLNIVDRARAEGDLVEGTRAVEPAPRAARPKHQVIVAAEQETGTRALAEDEHGERVESVAFDANPLLISEKWAKAVARIGRILEGTGRSSDFRAATRNAAMPALALEFMELYSYYMTRTRLVLVGRGYNPFSGLSDRDASRMFIAKTMNICDRSTGKLGWWYVK